MIDGDSMIYHDCRSPHHHGNRDNHKNAGLTLAHSPQNSKENKKSEL